MRRLSSLPIKTVNTRALIITLLLNALFAIILLYLSLSPRTATISVLLVLLPVLFLICWAVGVSYIVGEQTT